MAKISESTSISLNRQTTAPAAAPSHIGQPYVVDIAAVSGLARSLSLRVASGTATAADFTTIAYVPLGYNGNPDGSVTSRCDRDICFDTSVDPPNAYVSLTGGGTTWKLFGAAGGGGGAATTEAVFDVTLTDADQNGIAGSGGFAIFKEFGAVAINGHTSGFREIAALVDGVDYDASADKTIDITEYLEGTGLFAIAPFTLSSADRTYSSGSGCVATNNGSPAGRVVDVEFSSKTLTDNLDWTVNIVRAIDIRRTGATGVVIGWA